MQFVRSAGALSAMLLVVLCISGTARAGFIYDISISGFNATGSGQITFNSLSGSDTSGVDAFSFSGNGGLAEFSFSGPSSIAAIAWTIDPSNSMLDFSTLTTFNSLNAAGTGTCLALGSLGDECTAFNISGLPHSGLSFHGPSYMAQVSAITSTFSSALSVTTAPAPVQIPVPGTFALFLLGLLSLGILARRHAIGRPQIA